MEEEYVYEPQSFDDEGEGEATTAGPQPAVTLFTGDGGGDLWNGDAERDWPEEDEEAGF